jgi:hypothetical protein
MAQNILDPVILCFVLGLGAGVFRSNLRIPEAIYEMLSLYLLLAIGFKGGICLAEVDMGRAWLPLLSPLIVGALIPLVAYPILRLGGRLSVADSAALATHHGSTSAVTFAIVLEFLNARHVLYEEYAQVMLVLMEFPAILIGILIARLRMKTGSLALGKVFHEVFFGKSIYLLVGGLLIGLLADPARLGPIKLVFIDPFKGLLALFLLEMGIITSHRLKDLRKVGPFLVAFGVGMPILSAVLGAVIGKWVGLSFGGTLVLATLAASASYIAAPAAIRIAIPEANPTLYLTSALGITFPFNITFGIPLYYRLVEMIML